MGSFIFRFLVSFLLFFLTDASPLAVRRTHSAYAPVSAACPSTPLVRNADNVSSSESNYISSRYTKASANLLAWAKNHGSFKVSKAPVVALTSSGGGYRALLAGAGVIQGFDSRDSQNGVSGLYQGLTYHAGLSGGSWLLSSFAGNNYPTITYLRNNLWEPAFKSSLLVPSGLHNATTAYIDIFHDISAKDEAGFKPTLTDPWGRLLSWQLFSGTDGAVSDTLSGLTNQSNFTSHNVPYPIITALGVETWDGDCLPALNGTQYELHPYEFGSWDKGVNAFTPTRYLGSSVSNGEPTKKDSCTENYDNLGYVLGTSSNLFSLVCENDTKVNTSSSDSEFGTLVNDLELFLSLLHEKTTRDEFAMYPNPFRNYSHSSLVSHHEELSLVDGGLGDQNNPIWPLLHRDVDVIIVNDNSADTKSNYPNGSELYTTYKEAKAEGLQRMPEIPTYDVFISKGYDKQPVFFGCNNASTATIIYLPNHNYTFDSGEPTLKIEYTETQTKDMIANGVQVATKGGDKGWPLCLACGILKKASHKQPSKCKKCFKQYCYN